MGRRSQEKLRKRIINGKVSTLPRDEPWTKFERASVDGNYQVFDGTHWFDVYRNSRYTVMKRVITSTTPGMPDLIHLSIKRNDKAPVTKWRDLQLIKNELVGNECEGVQVFPAESRLVDTSNQTHLWVFNDPIFRLEIGYKERLVYEGNSYGAVQEPFEEHVRPKDLISEDKMGEAYRKFHGNST